MNRKLLTICLTGTLCTTAWSEDSVDEQRAENATPAAACTMASPSEWAISAVELFAEEQYAEAVTTVDACFAEWGPKGGHQQKAMHDSGTKCPRTGKVNNKTREKIHANGLLNDVSMALWAKARSLHELGEIEAATKAYSQCVYMSCGRAWDAQGWFWSPAEDCAKHVQELLE